MGDDEPRADELRARWADMYKETCEAAVVNKVQSPEVMDLRMECLNERLGGLRALTDVFSEATVRSWKMRSARRTRSRHWIDALTCPYCARS